MDKLIPIYYVEYGKYISRFRAIPFYADFLIPAQRRLLLSLHEMARGPKTVKSAKIIGHAIGSYHPHSDMSVYGTLVALAQQGFVKTQGNFGTPGLDDANASSMRYTEACLKPWVEDFCFKYIDYVGWQNFEYENEPTFLPCPLPIGLIGDGGVQLGIAFHKCVAPRYKVNDLAKRLKWLLMEKIGPEPIIYPNLEKDGCTIQEDDLAAKKLLETGISTLTIIPNGAIVNRSLHVYGRVPQTSFSSLKTDDNINIKCLSGKTLDIEIKPSKKQQDLNTFYSNIYSKHLIKDINFNMCVCDEEGKVSVLGVDDLLITCYSYYVEIVKLKKIDDTNKEIQKKYENEIILIIRNIIKNNPNVKMVNDIISHIKSNLVSNNIATIVEEYDYEKDCWNNVSRIILDEDIKNICNNKNIRSLIEQEININNNNIKIKELQNKIIDNENDCFKLIEELTTKTF